MCAAGYTYNAATGLCTKGALTKHNPTTANPTASSPTTITASASATNTINATASSTESPAPSSTRTDWYYAVQNTCRTGNLWNYATASSPTSAGAAALTNALNTAGILDYGALPGGYTVLTAGTKIAAESATTRPAATPIYYQLKISQNGLLSLSYSICPATGCGAWQAVLTKQNITTSNGPLPAELPVRLRRLHRWQHEHPRDPVLPGGSCDLGGELRGRQRKAVRQA